MLVLAPAATARERMMFVPQQYGATGISSFEVDLDTGALTQQPGITASGTVATVPGISPDGAHLYAPDFGNDALLAYDIGPGTLTPIVGSPFASGDGPNAAVVAPEGNHLWTADRDGGTASGFSIGSGGALASLSGFPLALGTTPTTLAISPRHNFVYSPGFGSNELAGYERAGDGSWTALAGFPLVHPGGPMDAEFTPDGEHLYVANQSADTISAYDINQSSGALTEVSGSPFAAGDEPTGLAVAPDGEHLIVANATSSSMTGSVSSFTIAPSGALSAADNEPAGWLPNDATITPDGRFAYIANFYTGKISGYELASDGTLTELAGSPFGDASGATASFAIVPNQGPLAAFAASVSGQSVTLDATATTDPDGTPAEYRWDFGDSQSETTAAPTTAHSYAAPGTYTVTLRVVDDEGCSDTQIGTGQTLYCNGSSAASVQHSVAIAAPLSPAPPAPLALSLTAVSGKQAKTRRNGRKITRRVRTRFSLSRTANVTFQFQRSRQGGTCRRGARASLRHKIRFRSFGKSMTRRAGKGKNQRTFANRLGGRRLTAGRYRVLMSAKASDGATSKQVTAHSFCVR